MKPLQREVSEHRQYLFLHSRLLALVLSLLLGLFGQDAARKNTADESPLSIHAHSQVVLVPTLVTTVHGDIVFGLTANDFVVEDNGIPQSLTLDEDPDRAPLSLVVIVQRGRSAYLHFMGRRPGHKSPDCRLDTPPCPTDMDGLSSMIEDIIGQRKARVAIVTFDDEVQLFQNFTNDVESFRSRLRLLTPGDQGAAILDSLKFSLRLLEREPVQNRRILLLISERRDHGSRESSIEQTVERIISSNILLYSVTFSPSRAEFWRDIRGKNPAMGKTDLLAPLKSSLQGIRKNTTRELADLTGGEYYEFKNRNEFEVRLGGISNKIRNRYLLSFQARNPSPGPHILTVKLRESRHNYSITARKSYWAQADPGHH